jgi:hypothetical protein
LTNGIALFLALAIAAALAADGLWNGWAASLFLARGLLDLIGTLAIWR